MLLNKTREAFNQLTLYNFKKKKKNSQMLKGDTLAIKWKRQFIYSRLDVWFPFLTSETWLISIIVFGALGYFASALIIQNFASNLIIMFLIIAALFFFEIFLSFLNFRKTDDNLIQFLNMLGNYSLTSGEITSVFGQIAGYLDDPLKTVLIECYNEAQTTGNSIEALQRMSDKIEHPKFKEIIKNLEVAIKYSADFKVVVDKNRRNIQDYLKAKQDRQALANENMVNIFILAACLVFALVLCGELAEMDVFTMLFTSFIGHVCLIVALICFLLLFWKNYTINKE